MSSKPAAVRLPAIAVEDELVKLSVQITRELSDEINQYAAYFEAVAGKKPRSQEAVVAGLLADCLGRDAAFQKWRKDASRSK